MSNPELNKTELNSFVRCRQVRAYREDRTVPQQNGW